MSNPISIIIPAYNEEAGVAHQILDVHQAMRECGVSYEIIVVDDGSEDKTVENAMQEGVRVIQHSENRGYGASLKTGILAAKSEIIVITDADGTYPADQIPYLVERLETADMVVGARTGENVHMTLVRRPAKWALGLLANHIAGRKIPDLNSGLRSFRRECVMQYFPVLSNRFSFTTTVTLAFIADDYRVVYHPINYYERKGASKIVPWHFFDFLVLIIRMSLMFNPLRVFIPLATFFGFLGVLKTIFDIVALFARDPDGGLSLLFAPALSTSAVLLLFVGLQFLMIGMVADGVVRRVAQHSPPMVPSQVIKHAEISVSTRSGVPVHESEQ